MPTAKDAGPGLDVTVVGSIHQDLIVDVTHLPGPGETVLGSGHVRSSGGKGANQAVAARRLGATVAMVGQVGDDPDGAALRAGLDREGVDVTAVVTDVEHATGLAVVTVDETGENSIVVSPGASGALSAQTVRTHRRYLDTARVVLLQLEVDLDAVVAAAELTAGILVLNPAPARDLPPALLERVDVLVPNRVELGRVAQVDDDLDRIEDIERVARRLAQGRAVVVTLGSQGALAVRNDETRLFPAAKVTARDSTGAGDTLCGALSARLAAGADLFDALPWAVRAAGLSTTRAGAQPSLPTLDELDRFDG